MARRNCDIAAQGALFVRAPPGLGFREEFVSAAEEARAAVRVDRLTFTPFEFHGWTGNRETVSFGWRYDFSAGPRRARGPIPDSCCRCASVPRRSRGSSRPPSSNRRW